MNIFSNLFIKKVYAASDFFDDYPKIKFTLITSDVAAKATEVLGNWYEILRWAWIFMFTFSLIAFVLSIARLAVHSNDNPFKREGYMHDLMQSVILLAIMGAMPVIFVIIINMLGSNF